ncbi:MAG: hypothetical protein ACI4PP_06195 [Clostridia bacterium]
MEDFNLQMMVYARNFGDVFSAEVMSENRDRLMPVKTEGSIRAVGWGTLRCAYRGFILNSVLDILIL